MTWVQAGFRVDSLRKTRVGQGVGLVLVQGWFRVGSGLVQGWFRVGSGLA